MTVISPLPLHPLPQLCSFEPSAFNYPQPLPVRNERISPSHPTPVISKPKLITVRTQFIFVRTYLSQLRPSTPKVRQRQFPVSAAQTLAWAVHRQAGKNTKNTSLHQVTFTAVIWVVTQRFYPELNLVPGVSHLPDLGMRLPRTFIFWCATLTT